MNSEKNANALQSTLGELAHLLINPSRLQLISGSKVGSGGFGDVYLAMLDGESKVAIKELKVVQASGTNTRAALRFARELKVWAKTKHPNVLKLVGFYLSENYSCAQLVSPFMENGNIIEYMHRTGAGIETRLDFMQGITLGMRYLHSHDPPICHGDLKPANVLINEKPDAVLCDFGLATTVEESGVPTGLTTSGPTKGSIRYMSPELFDAVKCKHTLKSDIWAWACTIFEIITDCTPYANCQSDTSIFAAIARGVLPGSVDLLASPAPELDEASHSKLVTLQALFMECWDAEPGDRPSSSSIIKRLKIIVPTQQSRDQTELGGSARMELTTPELSIRRGNQLSEWGYDQVNLVSQTADGVVSKKGSGPEVVYRFHDARPVTVSPTGKWIVTASTDGAKLWNMEDPSNPPIRLPFLCPNPGAEWSPNDRYLAYHNHDDEELYIWSTESQSIVGRDRMNRRSSLAWFSDSESLVVITSDTIYILAYKSGRFQREPNHEVAVSSEYRHVIATIPIDQVGGRRIVVITGGGEIYERRTNAFNMLKRMVFSFNSFIYDRIIVYDMGTQQILASTWCSHLCHLKVGKNGRVALTAAGPPASDNSPKLWSIHTWDDAYGVCNAQIRLIKPLALPEIVASSYPCYRLSFGGDNDEWAVLSNTGGYIFLWDEVSFQCIQGLPRNSGTGGVEVAVCRPKNQTRPLMFIFGHNGEDVAVWKSFSTTSD